MFDIKASLIIEDEAKLTYIGLMTLWLLNWQALRFRRLRNPLGPDLGVLKPRPA